MMKSRCRESTIIQSKHLDFAALHLDVAARHMKMQGKVFIHASMIHFRIALNNKKTLRWVNPESFFVTVSIDRIL